MIKHLLSLFFLIITLTASSQVKRTKLVPYKFTEIETRNDHYLIRKGKKINLLDIESETRSKNLRYDSISVFKNDVAIAKSGELKYFIDRNGNRVIEQGYKVCQAFIGNRSLVFDEDRIKIINEKGEFLFNYDYDWVHLVTDSFAYVAKGKENFIVDYNGNRLSETDLDKLLIFDVPSYLNGFLLNGKYGLLNANGSVLIPPTYSKLVHIKPIYYFEKENTKGFLDAKGKEIASFEGMRDNKPLYYLFKDGKFALFTYQGKFLSDYKYTFLRQFHGQYSIARVGLKSFLLDPEGKKITKEYSSISKQRQEVSSYWFQTSNGRKNINFINLKGEDFFQTDSTGYTKATMISDSLAIVRSGFNYYGVVNRAQSFTIPSTYHSIERFNENNAKAIRVVETNGEKDFQYGYLSLDGNFIEVECSYRNQFKNGFATFKPSLKDTNRGMGVIDSDLNIVVPRSAGYDLIKGPNEGTFLVRKNLKYGYLDLQGNVLHECQFKFADPYKNGIAKVDARRYINKKGEAILEIYGENFLTDKGPDNIHGYNNGFAVVQKGDKWGFIDEKGEFLGEVKYDSVASFGKQFARVWVGNNVGLIDRSGNMVIAPQFKSIEVLNAILSDESLLKVEKHNGKKGLLTVGEKYLLRPSFESIQVLTFNQQLSITNGSSSKSQKAIVLASKKGRKRLFQFTSSTKKQL